MAALRADSLSPLFRGERARVRGGHRRRRGSLSRPLTPTLSPIRGEGAQTQGGAINGSKRGEVSAAS